MLAQATAAVTGTGFGFVGLDPVETTELTALLAKVRRAAGDYAEPG